MQLDDHRHFRPPAVPLVTCDPYLSVWSFHDALHADVTRHWTGVPHALTALMTIDGKVYRVMGVVDEPPMTKEATSALPITPMAQLSVQVFPTRTVYRFQDAGVRLILTFTTSLLADDLDLMSRPFTYVSWEVHAVDGESHDVAFYFEASSELVVDTREQQVIGSRHQIDDLKVLRIGSYDQPVLEKSGDDLRIDWGYLYVAAADHDGVGVVVAAQDWARRTWMRTGALPESDDLRQPRTVRDETLVAAVSQQLGKVSRQAVSGKVIMAYDDVFSIEYLHRKLRGYWRRNGQDIGGLLKDASARYDGIVARCQAFDEKLMADLRKVGGEEYALIAALAYRQSLAAHKLVADVDGTPLLFSKENFSNGCIATVDVTYPTSPLFLLFNPELLTAAIRPILDYASSGRWPFPYAPHDLGTYPLANGQVYGGGERSEAYQMPVEECGNMLIMVSAVCLAQDDPSLAQQYKELLGQWANYLEASGFDPDHQLCTDDFAGHLAHNANLSLKAIVALKAYSRVCQQMGEDEEAERLSNVAQGFVQEWLQAADDGDHYRLAFDKPGSWSQKYNLVWDRLLELDLFPPEVAQKEIAFYKRQQNQYGLPLDSREKWTKVDWIVWTATLASTREDFEALITPLYAFVNESPSRVPLTDWYWTHDAKQVKGMQARPVVGGVFIKLLAEMWSAKIGNQYS